MGRVWGETAASGEAGDKGEGEDKGDKNYPINHSLRPLIPNSEFRIPKNSHKKPPLHTAELRGESLACLFLVFESFFAIGQRKCKEMDELR